MIYVDISAAVHSRAGLGRFSENLAKALIEARPEGLALFYNQGSDGRLPASLPVVPARSVKLGYKPWRTAVLAGHLAHIPFNRFVPNATLFHSTEHLLMPLKNVPTILTVHDLIYKLFPEYHKKLNYWYLNYAMPLFCRNATAIMTVSEASKRDLLAHYEVDPAKIHVVHEAAAAHFRPPTAEQIAAAREKYRLPSNFLIHLSTIEPRKNLGRLIDALQYLRSEIPNLQIVLVGNKGWLYDDLFARIKDENLMPIVKHLGWVPDEDLPAVIAAASLAVQPSLYEGFGLPILEHMASGQVVAASKASSFPEVGGDAAAYFDPLNVPQMTAVIHRLLTNPDEYRQRREMGLRQAQKFSWQRAAQETLEIYNSILEEQESEIRS